MNAAAGERQREGEKKKSISRKFFRVVTDDCDVFLLFKDGVVEWGVGGTGWTKKCHHPVVTLRS